MEILPWHTEFLRSLMARRAQLPHAILLHGRAGIGKVLLARAFAQSLLCESPDNGLACGKCSACEWFAAGNHPDFRELVPEIDAADAAEETESIETTDSKEKKKSREIKIEQVRAVADFMTLSTHRDGFRVLLIHPAEALNMASANALLKTLEEPPPRTIILLVSHQLGRLLATIRSRCQKLLIPVPETSIALEWLKRQGVASPEAALAAAGGAPLDAVSFAAPEYAEARSAFVRALTSSPLDYSAAGQAFDKADMNAIVHWLQTWVADVLLHKTCGSVRFFSTEAKAIAGVSAKANAARLLRFEAELRQARRLTNHPLNPRLFVEQLLISYAQSIRP